MCPPISQRKADFVSLTSCRAHHDCPKNLKKDAQVGPEAALRHFPTYAVRRGNCCEARQAAVGRASRGLHGIRAAWLAQGYRQPPPGQPDKRPKTPSA